MYIHIQYIYIHSSVHPHWYIFFYDFIVAFPFFSQTYETFIKHTTAIQVGREKKQTNRADMYRSLNRLVNLGHSSLTTVKTATW